MSGREVPIVKAMRRGASWSVLGAFVGIAFGLWAAFVGNAAPSLSAVAEVSSASDVGAAAAPASARIVYLPDASRPGIGLSDAGARGAQVVSSVAEMKAAAPAADALILDNSQVAAAAAGDWLKAQRTSGRIIMALNTPMDALERAAGTPFEETGPFRLDWGGTPFYSYVFETPAGQYPRYATTGSDQLPGPDIVFAIIQKRYEQRIGTFRPLAMASPTARP